VGKGRAGLLDDVDLVGKKRVNGSDPNALPRAPSTGRGAEEGAEKNMN
jgi:hypothetical protein